MSDLKPRGEAITLDGVERHIMFTLNVIDDIQEHYKKLDEDGDNIGMNLLQVLQAMTDGDNPDNNKILCFVMTTLLNDEAERTGDFDTVTERQVGGMIGLDNYGDVLNAILRAYGVSMPDAEEDESPNVTNRETTK